MDLSQVEQLLTVKQVAEKFGVEPRVVRRAVRKGTINGVVSILGRTGFVPEAVADWTPPEPGVFGARGPAREDGRRRYTAFLTEEEHTLLSATYEIVDPRIAAKARRAARKAAKLAAGEGETSAEVDANPFADFEAE